RIVVLADQRDEPAIMDITLLRREHAALAQGFEDVVELGEGQVDMLGKHALAEDVEGFSLLPQAPHYALGCLRRERKWIKATGLVVPRIVSHTQSSPCRERPNDVDPARKHGQSKGVIEAKRHQRAIRDGCLRQKDKEPVLCCL